MAKKLSSTKKSSAASSSKAVKSSPVKRSIKATKPVIKATAKKVPVKAKSGKVSYKQEYIKLLKKTNNTLNKEIKSIRKAIEQPDFMATREAIPYEAFPKEPSITPVRKPITAQPAKSIEQQILEQLQDIEIQIRSRDMAFEDLVSGSAKLGGFHD